MAVNKYDLVFLKHFAMVIGVLFLIMVVLILGALYVNNARPQELTRQKLEQIESRIAPVGAVYAGDTGRQAMLAAQEAARLAAASQVAYEGTLEGAVIYDKLCQACHTTGAGGAPKLLQAEWAARIGQGVDVLVQHAIEGYQKDAPTAMPARGGNPALSDEQVRATVQWMVDNIK